MAARGELERSLCLYDRLLTSSSTLGDIGWWAYYGDEPRSGPFDSEAEAARAGLEAWGPEKKPTARVSKKSRN